MTEELNPVEEIINEEITDEQLDKFFEDGGKPDVAPKAAEPDIETSEESIKEEPAKAPEDKTTEADVEEEKHARNYQAAMKEERLRRQELALELAETKANQARMEATFQKVIQKQEQEAQPQIPSYEEDPLGHLSANQKEIADYAIRQNQYLLSQKQAADLHNQKVQFINSYGTQAQEFAKETPEFFDAYNYMIAKKRQEYMAAGVTQQEADQQIEFEETRIVSKAFRDGVNPASRVYAMAKVMGYSAAPSQAPKDDTAMLDVSKKLEQLQRDMKVNRSLSNAPSKSSVQTALTLEKLSQMDDDEFDKNWNKVMKAG